MEAPPSSEEEAMATLITIALVVFLSLAAASAYAAGWLLYQLCAQVLIPFVGRFFDRMKWTARHALCYDRLVTKPAM
jgi:hypothetical protein